MLYQNQLTDLLDRKFRLVTELPAKDFILELENFVHFVRTNEQLRVFGEHLNTRLLKTAEDFNLSKAQLIRELQSLRQQLTAKLPQVDDSDLLPPDTTQVIDPHDHYHRSLAYFDASSQKAMQEAIEGPIKRFDDLAIPSLIHILQEKLDRDLLGDEDYEYFLVQINNLENKDVHLRRKARNYFHSSPEAALNALYYLTGHINPEPAQYHTWSDVMDEAFKNIFDSEGRERTRIQEIVYGDKEDEDLIRQCQVYLRRAYEGLRAEIGSHLIHYQIVQRYKTRCTVYDRDRLGRLVAENEGNEEDALTRDLAIYLFDNGISTLYRVGRGTHEYDLIGQQSIPSIFIEVKVHKASKNLVNGLAQLHSYLNTVESEELLVWEVYYVVYRLGGPLYDLPWEIPTNRRAYYPVVIDLAPSSESGSHQPRPIQINLEDFFQAIKDEMGTRNGAASNKAG
jgi:hypothetical protein